MNWLVNYFCIAYAAIISLFKKPDNPMQGSMGVLGCFLVIVLPVVLVWNLITYPYRKLKDWLG